MFAIPNLLANTAYLPAGDAFETDALALALARATEPTGKRSKLWELPEKHHCPIVGTCLPLNDLVRLAKRFHFTALLHDEYALHVEAVHYAHTKNEVSITMQRFLDKKFQIQINQFSREKTSEGVLKQWKHCLSHGQVAAGLWASYTHKACNADIRQIVFGDIHMLSHQVGAGQAADARRLATLEKECAQLKLTQENERQNFQSRINGLLHEKTLLLNELGDTQALQQQLEETQQRLSAFESGLVIVELGQKLMELQTANEHLILASQRTWDLEKNLKAAHAEMEKFALERDEALADRHAMEALLNSLRDTETESTCPGQSEDNCAGCEQSLTSRCVLYVGGRASMIAHYRQLADRIGIQLIHHDGGLEESLSRLPDMIHTADAVVCPTDNISHSAYYQVKNHCKRVGKPCLFYTGTGISSFASAMNKVQKGEFSLALA